MKRMGLFLLILMSSFTLAWGREKTSVTILSGYTTSAYEDQKRSRGALPFGLQIGYMVIPRLQVGFEVNHLLGGLTWEKYTEYPSYKRQITFSQTIHSAYVKFYEGHGNTKLFCKGGIGYFMGDMKDFFKYNVNLQETQIYPIESALGFVVGGGMNIGNIFYEFDYNIVSHVYGRLKTGWFKHHDDDKVGMNTWSVMIGYKFNL